MGVAFSFAGSKFVSHAAKLIREAEKKQRRALLKTGIAIVREAKESMARSKRGIMHPGAKRRSSAPGEPPAAQHGGAGLQGRINYEKLHKGDTIRIGTNLDYGRELEFGRPGVAARPWLRPAVEAKKGTFEQEMAK